MATNNRLSNAARYWGGRAKESIGRLSGNRRTQYEGKLDQAKANVKDTGLDVRNAFRRRRRVR
ncbi:CsbD family protein [Mycobacterium sp. ML4]